jgi:hypothetical protein
VLTRPYSAPLWLGIYLTLQLAAPFLRLPLRSPWALIAAVALSATIFTVLSLAIFASLTHAVRRPLHAVVFLVVGVAGWGLFQALGPMLPNPPNLARLWGPPGILGLHLGIELFRIIATLGLGVLLASALKEPNILLPAAVFAAFADYFMVNFGTVHHQMKTEAGQKFIHAVSAKVPTLPGLPVLTVGPADFVFMAFFFACVYRFGLDLKRTFLLMAILLTAALLFVVLFQAPIPALAPMALAFVGANFRCFRLSRSEKQAMGAAAAIVLAAAVAFVALGGR